MRSPHSTALRASLFSFIILHYHEIQGIAGFAGLLLTLCVLLNNRVLSHGCAPPQISRCSLILPLSQRFNVSQVSLFDCEFLAFSSEIVYNHGIVHTYFFNNPTLSQVSTHLKFCRFVVDSLCFVRNHVLSRSFGLFAYSERLRRFVRICSRLNSWYRQIVSSDSTD